MTPPRVQIYATSWCPYCERARQLLTQKHIPFEEIDVDTRPEARTEMQARSGRSTVPQIFIGDTHIGGCDDLYELEEARRLDPLLKP